MANNIKIATFNLNNLFERVKVMELEGFSKEGKQVLADVSKLNQLLEKKSYAGETGREIIKLLEKYFHTDSTTNQWFRINEVREKLFSRKRDGSGLTLKPSGRADWLGWVELLKQKTNEISIENTARVITAVNPDILCTVEVDSRIALKHFNDWIIKDQMPVYEHTMVIDGNDERGIDVGVLSRYEIETIVSHVDDKYTDKNKRKQNIFSRDCAEYKLQIGNKRYIHLLCNHLKSKGYGAPAQSDAKRKLQADRVAEILKKYDLKKDYVVVAGDLNDTPKSKPLANLMKVTDLHDVLDSNKFTGERWTYHHGKDQIDYLLVSKALFDLIKKVGIERRGMFRKGNKTFTQVTNAVTQASDHACVWAEFSL